MTIDTILQGDVRSCLHQLEDQSVQCCVTSPPYWGLRDYGVEGQIGLEPTPEAYVADLVEVFREVRRVLRDDGTLWLNLGDSYAGSGKGMTQDGQQDPKQPKLKGMKFDVPEVPVGLKPKDLVGIPWRVAFALQADGWYLRSDIIWNKPNPMPESVTDRCTKSHEYIFLLTKSERYYYDAEAIKETSVTGDDNQPRGSEGTLRHSVKRGEFNGKTNEIEGREAFRAITETRNKRDVWTVATEPCSEAHFAVFPSKLIEPMILAGSPRGGVVLDPFMGSGTTALQCVRLQRHYLGCELNPSYVKMAERRIAAMRGPLFEKVAA